MILGVWEILSCLIQISSESPIGFEIAVVANIEAGLSTTKATTLQLIMFGASSAFGDRP